MTIALGKIRTQAVVTALILLTVAAGCGTGGSSGGLAWRGREHPRAEHDKRLSSGNPDS